MGVKGVSGGKGRRELGVKRNAIRTNSIDLEWPHSSLSLILEGGGERRGVEGR